MSSHEPDERAPLLQNGATSPSSPDEASTEQVILPEPISKKRMYITLCTIYFGVFFGALDTTIIATLSAPISNSFNSLSLLSWLASAYLIANAACQPLSGRLTDIFSRRTGLVVSNVLFATGNLICGLAKSEWTMILGRVVSGMGGGGLMAIATFVASDLVPLRQRGMVQAFGNICFGSGAGLGGVFGGWVNDTWGWRVAFLAQVPPVIVSGILVWCIVDIPPKKSEKSKLSRVDFLGASTLVLTLMLLLLGLNSGGNVVPWNHPLVYISLPLSAVALSAFIYVEARIATEPIIPVHLLMDRTVAFACLTNWFCTMVTFMGVFYVPIFFQVKGLSTTQAGARLIPQSIGASIGSLIAGIVMNKTGKYKNLGFVLTATLTVGVALLSSMNFHTPDWPPLLYMFLIGTGYAGMLVVTLLAVVSAIDHEHQAVVTSATYAFRSTGSTIGVTIGSAVYQNVLLSQLHSRFDGRKGAESEIRRIRNSLDELKHLPEGWRDGVYDSYEMALRSVFLTAVGVSVLGTVCYAFVRQHTLHKTLERRASSSS